MAHLSVKDSRRVKGVPDITVEVTTQTLTGKQWVMMRRVASMNEALIEVDKLKDAGWGDVRITKKVVNYYEF